MKYGFSILILAAVVAWGWVALRIAQVYWSPTGGQNSMRVEANLHHAMRAAARLQNPGGVGLARDPFQSSLSAEAPQPVPKPASETASAAKGFQVAEPPPFQIQGVLMGADPMVIVKAGESTEFVKLGQAFMEYKFEIIEANRIVVQKRGRRYTLPYP